MPIAFLDIACGDILDEDALSNLFASSVELQPFVTNNELALNTGPISYALQQLGGIECEWSNGQPARDEVQTANPEYVGATLRVFPDAAEEWQEWAEYYSVSGDRSSACASDGETPCEINALSGSTWVQLTVGGPADAEATGAAMDTVLAAIDSAAPSESQWSPPAGTVELANDCAQFFSAADVQSLLGMDTEIFLDGRDGGDSLIAQSWEAAGTSGCPWIVSELTGLGGSHSWLEGGDWAFDVERERRTEQPTELAATGLEEGDSAWVDCAAADQACILDVIVAHDWIQVELTPSTLEQYSDADPLEVVTALADSIVAAVRS